LWDGDFSELWLLGILLFGVLLRLGQALLGVHGSLLGEHESYVYFGADGDFAAVYGEGFVAPLADGGYGGVGELGIAADGTDLLHAAVGADQGFENDRSLDVGAAGGVGIVGFYARIEEILGELGLQAHEAAIDEVGVGVRRERFCELRGWLRRG
jgi:hypothetical protein